MIDLDALLMLALALVVLSTGPGLIVARAVARWGFPAPKAKAMAPSLRMGLSGATLVAGLLALVTPEFGRLLTLLMVCLWLGLSDWVWRWLPLTWVLATWAAGLGHAWLEGAWVGPLVGSLAVSGCLFALQATYQGVRGREGLGTGDVLFLGAVAAWVGPADAFLVTFGAAVLGLGVAGLLKILGPTAGRRRYGVAFGTYLALMFAIMVILRHPV
ncbi:MAG: A24 family peptidase [Pseudomonadota bacterium]